jgi:transposase-like protein
MEKLPRQVYTREFRQQAVEMVTREGLSIAEAARRLSLSPKTRLTGSGARGAASRPQPRHRAARSRRWRPSYRGCGAITPSCV